MRGLGSVQIQVLQALNRHRQWHRGCGWHWDGWGSTQRIFEGLAKRGVVDVVEQPGPRHLGPIKIYTLNVAGAQALAEHEAAGKR